MGKTYSRFLDMLEKIQRAILTVSVAAMVVLMVYQVILRYVFSNSNAWSEELIRYLFILNVMLASPIAIRRNNHLQIDVLINCFSPRVKRIFTVLATLAGIVFLCFLLKYSIDLCMTATNNVSAGLAAAGLNVSMAIPYASLPLGAVLMILTSIEVVLKTIGELHSGQEVSS